MTVHPSFKFPCRHHPSTQFFDCSKTKTLLFCPPAMPSSFARIDDEAHVFHPSSARSGRAPPTRRATSPRTRQSSTSCFRPISMQSSYLFITSHLVCTGTNAVSPKRRLPPGATSKPNTESKGVTLKDPCFPVVTSDASCASDCALYLVCVHSKRSYSNLYRLSRFQTALRRT
jgi:hypothetical protein